MAGNAVESGRTVTSKVTALLMVFADGTDWSLSELARLTGIPLTTAHRLVTELVAAQLLERAPEGYRVGPALGRLRAPEAPDGPTVARLAPAVLDDLAAVTGCAVRLGVLRDLRVLYVEKAGRGPVTSFAAGAQLPLHASAIGKVLLAFGPTATARALAANGLPRFTSRTLTRADQLLHALSVIRLTRFATCDGELVADEITAAAPVTGPGGRVIAALEAVVPDLTAVDTVRQLLTVSARSMSREMAGPAPAVVSVAS